MTDVQGAQNANSEVGALNRGHGSAVEGLFSGRPTWIPEALETNVFDDPEPALDTAAKGICVGRIWKHRGITDCDRPTHSRTKNQTKSGESGDTTHSAILGIRGSTHQTSLCH